MRKEEIQRGYLDYKMKIDKHTDKGTLLLFFIELDQFPTSIIFKFYYVLPCQFFLFSRHKANTLSLFFLNGSIQIPSLPASHLLVNFLEQGNLTSFLLKPELVNQS